MSAVHKNGYSRFNYSFEITLPVFLTCPTDLFVLVKLDLVADELDALRSRNPGTKHNA